MPQVLRADAGGRSLLFVDVPDGATLADVLDVVAAEHPGLDRRLRDEQRVLRRHVNFYLGDEECRGLGGAGAQVRAGTEVRIIPSVAGG
nr:MoaD/ThiS family protein [Saccharopolyspora sp. HNM0983]